MAPFAKGFLSALLLIIAVIAVAPISPWISAVLVGIGTFYLLPLTAILFVGQWESQFLSQVAASLLIITPIIFGFTFEQLKKNKAVLVTVLILAALNSYIVLQLLSDNFIVE